MAPSDAPFDQCTRFLCGHGPRRARPQLQLAIDELPGDERKSKQFAMHATSHLELHEKDAYRELHGLQSQLLGDDSRLFPAERLNAANRELAADTQVMLFGSANARDAKTSKIGISLGSACESLSDEEIETLFRRLVESCD